jgi:hypothetical protein
VLVPDDVGRKTSWGGSKRHDPPRAAQGNSAGRPRPSSARAARAASVEVLTAYSHTTHVADLRICVKGRRSGAVSVPQPPSRRPWSLRDRLDERTRLELIAAYRAGATAASIASGHGLSVRSVKRLVAAAGVRRKQVPT